jgi:hypothetical protein
MKFVVRDHIKAELRWVGLPYHRRKDQRKISESPSSCILEREDANLATDESRSEVGCRKRRGGRRFPSASGFNVRQAKKFQTAEGEKQEGAMNGSEELDSGSIGRLAKKVVWRWGGGAEGEGKGRKPVW